MRKLQEKQYSIEGPLSESNVEKMISDLNLRMQQQPEKKVTFSGKIQKTYIEQQKKDGDITILALKMDNADAEN